MNFYTKEWKDFIYKNHYNWINKKDFECHLKYTIVPENRTIKDETQYLIFKSKEELDNYIESKILEENNLAYSDKLLKERFDKYYNAKKEYIENIDNYKLKFGSCEEIKILSYKEEFKLYKERFNKYANELEKKITRLIEVWINKEEDYSKEKYINGIPSSYKYIINEEKISKIENLNNIDSRIIALFLGKHKYQFIYDNLILSNEVNGFLTSYNEYLKQLPIKYDYKLMAWINFHDATIVKYKFNKDNNQLNGLITIEDDYEVGTKYTFILKNVTISGEEKHINDWITDYDYGDYEDKKFYLRFDDTEFSADTIEVFINYKDN